jgi:SAM-dependent methyltransferase
MFINKIAQINDMNELDDELKLLRNIGYSGEYDNIYYDYIYKWARILKISKILNMTNNKTILEIGGGLSPLQFIFSNNDCIVYNLDENFETSWFPTNGKFYIRASNNFINESKQNINNINYIRGNIIETIKKIPSNSIDFAIDTCAMHIFITDELINEITRVLKPNGYLLSVGDIANPFLGRCDEEFFYPKVLQQKISVNPNLQLVSPFDYDSWDQELKDYNNIQKRKNVNYNDLSLINMKSDPSQIPYKNIPIYPIHIWTATYLLQKN